MLDAHRDVTETRSGPELRVFQMGKPWCPLLRFQGKLTKESQVLLGRFCSSWKKPVCHHLHMMPPGHQLQQALDQAERVPSFDLQLRLFVKTNRTALGSGGPAGNSPSSAPGERGGAPRCCPSESCVITVPRSFQDGGLTHGYEMRG